VVYELPVRTYLSTDDSVVSILIVLEKSILLPSMSTLLQQQNIWGFKAGKSETWAAITSLTRLWVGERCVVMCWQTVSTSNMGKKWFESIKDFGEYGHRNHYYTSYLWIWKIIRTYSKSLPFWNRNRKCDTKMAIMKTSCWGERVFNMWLFLYTIQGNKMWSYAAIWNSW